MITTKKLFIAGVTIVLLLGGSTFLVHAGNAGDGSDYGTQNGFVVSNSQTICAGHGAFGFFGKDWNLGNLQSGHYLGGSYPGPGANGHQTGINNSSLCGNPQN